MAVPPIAHMNEDPRRSLRLWKGDQLASLTSPILGGFAGLLVILVVTSGEFSHAQTSDVDRDKPSARRMIVDPSSSSVALGKANLIVSPLNRAGAAYHGGYQLKVTPYFFKSEKGKLQLGAPDEVVRKLAEGVPVEFTGKATNSGDGKVKVVTGKATPASKDHGKVTFSVDTENGKMVFNTTYRFAD